MSNGNFHTRYVLRSTKMQYLVSRMKEPSTYAGLAALLAAFGLNIDAGILQAVVAILTGLAGLASVLIGEKSA
jgi:hypothetical protein